MRLLILDSAEKEFLDLDIEVRRDFDSLFDAFKAGENVRAGFKKMEGIKNMYEFRLRTDKRIVRALAGFIKPNYIIVLVFNKKQQKTPANVIKKATKRFEEYKKLIN